MTYCEPQKEKLVFMLLPYWTPLIPPMGLACLKSYLSKYGYNVKNYDLNISKDLRESFYQYLKVLESVVDEVPDGQFHNIANEVLRNHLMCELSDISEDESVELVETIFKLNFYQTIPRSEIDELNRIVTDIYDNIEKCFIEIMEKESPIILGLSIFNGTLPISLYVCKLAKVYNPDIKIIVGGGIFSDDMAPGSSSFERFLSNTPEIDKVFVGEGEILVLKYLQEKLDDDKKVYTQNEQVYGSILLESLDIPEFDDFQLDYYPYIATSVSRSCPFQCSFCSETVNWGKYRKKNPKQIVSELKRLYTKYNRQIFLMADSLLNPVITELSDELSQEDISFYWDGYLRADPDSCSLQNTFLWRKAGYYRARLGLESGSEKVLKLMDKKIVPSQIKKAVACLAEAGIKTTTYWVVGYPGETEEDFQQTLDLISEMKDDIYEAHCNSFAYYQTGQVSSKKWREEYNEYSLYPEKYKDNLLLETFMLKTKVSREEVYNRVKRFNNHLHSLGIADPLSLHDIYQADLRWKNLHYTAVPMLAEFSDSTYINENKNIKIPEANARNAEINDWCFD